MARSLDVPRPPAASLWGGAGAIGSPDWFSSSMEATPSPQVLEKRKNKNLKKKNKGRLAMV